MFNRNNLLQLRIWAKESDRKPLVLRGARQTGKTSLVNIFSKEFDQYIYLNLEKEEDNKLFSVTTSFSQLLDAIFFLKNADRSSKKVLLFIDEIQNNPKAVAMLRYFYEEAKELFVIAAGSLLETLIDKNISFPVGRVDYLAVRPFSFEEFIEATGETKSLALILNLDVPIFAHDKIRELFQTYSIIGGMPEIVKDYCENRDFGRLRSIYERLLVSYLDDVEKYASNQTQTHVIRHIISSAFHYAGTRIAFEKFGHSQYRSREMGEAFRILEKTMLLQLMYPVSQTKLPIQEKTRLSPKLFMLDTGLVNHASGLQKALITSKLINENYPGKISEHIVGQQLLAFQSSVRSKLHFWVPDKPDTQAEVDYVVQFQDLLLPIEVKSGASGSLRSLHRFVDESPHDWAVRVYDGKFTVEDTTTVSGKKFRLINLPFYLVGQIEGIAAKVTGIQI